MQHTHTATKVVAATPKAADELKGTRLDTGLRVAAIRLVR